MYILIYEHTPLCN